MKSSIAINVALLLLLMWSSGCKPCSSPERMTRAVDQGAMASIINTLSYKLVDQIGGRDNYFISPLSISLALAMVYLGTHGSTRYEMITALGYKAMGKECFSDKVMQGFKELVDNLERRSDEYSFLVANGVFVQAGYDVYAEFLSDLRVYFDSHVGVLDFAKAEQESMREINGWVANHTNGRIAKLINEPLDHMTVMVLLNAVYFKGLWSHPFRSTWMDNFKKADGSRVFTEFMSVTENMKSYDDSDVGYSFLELDYEGESVSMLLALPKTEGRFPDLSLDNGLLKKVRASFTQKQVLLVMPKFKLEYRRELSKDMINLGIGELFSEGADLTRITAGNDLHVSLMIHKAMIEVNEQGSEASAVSGVGIDGRRGSSAQVRFVVNHPFLFYILDKGSGAILFAGRVVDPAPNSVPRITSGQPASNRQAKVNV